MRGIMVIPLNLPKKKGVQITEQEIPLVFPSFCRITEDNAVRILATKFPYNISDGPFCHLEKKLRLLDTLRPASGATSAKLLGVEDADPFLVYMYESGGLWLELGISLEDWLIRGQLGFFFPHIRECLESNIFFVDEDWQESITEMTFGVWKNHVRLMQIVSELKTFPALIALIEWSVENDCTLPEYLDKAKELGL